MTALAHDAPLAPGVLRLPRHWLPVVVAYLVLWSALSAASRLFEARGGVSVWYPPAALDICLLLVLGLRFAPALLLTVLPSVLLFAHEDEPLWLVLPLIVTNVTVEVATVSLLVRHLDIDPRLVTQRDVTWLVGVGCVGAPLVTAVLQVLQLTSAGQLRWADAPVNVVGSWAGTATGVGMLAPVLLLASRRVPALWRDRPPVPAPVPPRPGRRELALQALATVVATWAAFGGSRGGALDFTYLTYIPLIWIAVRDGFNQVAVALLALNVLAVLLVGDPSVSSAIALQLGLVTMTLAGLVLGALVNQRRSEAARARHDALHDPLTSLPNRTLLLDRVTQAAHRTRRHTADRFALLYLDLDRFKSVNDTLGHDAGDRLLIEAGRRMLEIVRPTDTVSRLGGDEFGVLLDDLRDDDEAAEIAGRMLRTLGRPYAVAGREVVLAASIGICVNAPDAGEAGELLQHADLAMQRAKDQGRNAFTFYSHDLRADAVELMELRTALHRAVSRRELTVVFQPVVTLPGRTLLGVEALSRWDSPVRGPVPPEVFIPAAEDTGLIGPLGRQVLLSACEQFARWQGGAPGLRLAVNVSRRQLRSAGYVDEVLAALAANGLAPGQLSLEITEGLWLEQPEPALGALRRLAEAGVHLVIDDFGTGFSSLAALRDFAVHGIKLDRSFVGRMIGDVGTLAIIQAILSMADSLGLEVTAEGVETAEQLEVLESLGCTRGQGRYLGVPVPATQLPEARST